MVTEETGKDRAKEMKIKISFLIATALLIYYSIMAILSPGKKMEELYSEFAPVKEGQNTISEKLISDSAYIALLHEKSFLSSRVEMAETDSVYLTISLPDSTVNLEISGVTVHTARLSEIEVSRMLEKGNRYMIYSMFSSPLSINNEIASIKKEPLMVSIAPKDTSEFQPDVIPDTTGNEHVNFILELDHGIKVYFYQEEKEGSFSTFRFDLSDRLRYIASSLRSAAVFRIPEYHPYIRLRLPREDARAIYRAVPEKGQVGIYL